MQFKKTGEEIVAILSKTLDQDREALNEAVRIFEREKDKGSLQRVEELKVEIARFERIIKHTRPEVTYDMTEQDLLDFGF